MHANAELMAGASTTTVVGTYACPSCGHTDTGLLRFNWVQRDQTTEVS
jgi:hypothetical protein